MAFILTSCHNGAWSQLHIRFISILGHFFGTLIGEKCVLAVVILSYFFHLFHVFEQVSVLFVIVYYRYTYKEYHGSENSKISKN